MRLRQKEISASGKQYCGCRFLTENTVETAIVFLAEGLGLVGSGGISPY